MRLKTIFSCTAVFLMLLLHAQQDLHFNFRGYTLRDGLLTKQCFSVAQDEEGFVWVGTAEGLQRYDAFRFKNFGADLWQSIGINSISVRQLLFRNKNELWILFDGGEIARFNTKTFAATRVPVEPRDKKSFATSVKEIKVGKEGQLFFLHGGQEVMAYHPGRDAFISRYLFLPLLYPYQVADFQWQPGTDNYYIMLQGGGFMVYNDSTRTLYTKSNSTGTYPLVEQLDEDIHPYNLFFDSRQRAWFFSWHGAYPKIYCYDLRANRFLLKHKDLPQLGGYYELVGITEHSDGELWIYGAPLLGRINQNTLDVELVENRKNVYNSIYYEIVTQVLEDREQNLWVATNNDGLYRFNPNFRGFRTIPHRNTLNGGEGKGAVMDFFNDTDSTFVASTWGDGLIRYNRELREIPLDINIPSGQRAMWSMASGKDSNLVWMGSQPGVYLLDLRARSMQYFNPPTLNDHTVRQILQDKTGNVWFGLQNFGLHCWVQPEKSNFSNATVTPVFGLPRFSVHRIMQDSEGLIWVAYGQGGLYAISPTTLQIVYHFGEDEIPPYRIPSGSVADVVEMKDSLIAFMSGKASYLFDKRSRTLRKAGALAQAGYSAGLNVDNKNRLWMSTTSGLFGFDRRNRVSMHFLEGEGLENNQFILASTGRTSWGDMLFGTSEELVAFNPDSVLHAGTLPAVKITEVLLGDKNYNADSLTAGNVFEFPADYHGLVVRFSPLRFKRDIGVYYKLEGFDKNWRMADETMTASYNYLPHGSYKLLLMTVNAEGKMNVQPAALTIKVIPPVFQRWWFILICLLLIASAIYYADKQRLSRRNYLLGMRSGIARNLHRDVNNGLQNINILSEIARMKADSDPEKTSDYIQLIKDKSSDMMRAMDDMLWSIDPANDNMVRTLDRMQELLDSLNHKHNVVFDLLVDPRVRDLTLNMQLRHEAFILFRECVQGIVSCGATNCNIHLGHERNLLLMNIQFGNANCDIHQLNNLFQRQEMAARLKAIRANLQVNYHKTISNFNITIPVVAA